MALWRMDTPNDPKDLELGELRAACGGCFIDFMVVAVSHPSEPGDIPPFC